MPTACMPLVARLMALAIWFDQLIRDGVVADQAELARVGHVSRARLTQIMNLLFFAPDLQEQVLFLTQAKNRLGSTTEKQQRPIATQPNWKTQRDLWQRHLAFSEPPCTTGRMR